MKKYILLFFMLVGTMILNAGETFIDNFADDLNWKFGKGAQISNGQLDITAYTIAVLQKKFSGTSRNVEVDITPVKVNTDKKVYKFAGIRLINKDSYWAFQLVERPGGSHYLELHLYQNKKWKYEIGKTKEIAPQSRGRCWEYGKTYRLKLELDQAGITGTLLESKSGRKIVRIQYELIDKSLLRSGTPALFGKEVQVKFTNFKSIIKQ